MKKEESRRRRSCKNLLKHKTYKKGPCTWGDDSIKNFPQKIKKKHRSSQCGIRNISHFHLR